MYTKRFVSKVPDHARVPVFKQIRINKNYFHKYTFSTCTDLLIELVDPLIIAFSKFKLNILQTLHFYHIYNAVVHS